jgi:hypothetical protein
MVLIIMLIIICFYYSKDLSKVHGGAHGPHYYVNYNMFLL